MTREEAIAFLQEIKYNIDYLQTHYAQQKLKSAAEQQMRQETQLQDIQLQLEKVMVRFAITNLISHPL